MVDPTNRRVRTANARVRSAPAREVQGTRSTTVGNRVNEEIQDEALPTQRFEPGQEPAFVRVSAGRTYNIGNYESLRLDVSVTLPCLPEETELAYEQARDYVIDKMANEERHWLGGIGNSAQSVKRQAKRR